MLWIQLYVCQPLNIHRQKVYIVLKETQCSKLFKSFHTYPYAKFTYLEITVAYSNPCYFT